MAAIEEDPAEEVEECSICLEPFVDELPPVPIRCGHHFHRACLTEWLACASSCPLCRAEIVELSADGKEGEAGEECGKASEPDAAPRRPGFRGRRPGESLEEWAEALGASMEDEMRAALERTRTRMRSSPLLTKIAAGMVTAQKRLAEMESKLDKSKSKAEGGMQRLSAAVLGFMAGWKAARRGDSDGDSDSDSDSDDSSKGSKRRASVDGKPVIVCSVCSCKFTIPKAAAKFRCPKCRTVLQLVRS
eukprot:PLAT2840.1.p1 GENE.PLAT2840.1~~PLAT2840.1.p1  ORF type:complete len:247 (+),score=102.02 PLAT2840.1:97-837(+)